MDMENKNGGRFDVDIAALRKAASGGNSPRFWRSLDELADTPDFRDHKENEFPHGANDPGASIDRRELLKVMAASAAFAGLLDSQRTLAIEQSASTTLHFIPTSE